MVYLRYKLYSVCHSGLDPESSVFLDSCFRRNDRPRMFYVAMYNIFRDWKNYGSRIAQRAFV
jgi:hypothetical protein